MTNAHLKLVYLLLGLPVLILISLLVHAFLQTVCKEFAKQNRLSFRAAPKPFISSDRITGIYRGRRLEFEYWHILFLHIWDIRTTSMTLSTSCYDKRLHISRRPLLRAGSNPQIEDREFNQRISVQSKPKHFAAIVLGDGTLRRRILKAIPFMSKAKLTIYPSGRITLEQVSPLWTVRQMEESCELLSSLADVAEGTLMN
jgi:hypothetical protein